MNRTASLLMCLLLLLAACAPATVQTGSGPQTVTVIGGVGYTLSNRVPVEALTDQTPNDAAITFTACKGGAVSAADVRRVGTDVALKACQQAIQRAADAQNGLQIAGLILLPVGLAIGYFVYRLTLCPISFNAGPGCQAR